MSSGVIIGSSRAFRLALLDAGLLDVAEQAAKSNERLAIQWNHSINIVLGEEWLSELAGLMGIDSSKVESLIEASWSL
ncbi:MAG: hypothetical protein P8P29_06385 [Flavobacteriaceae bacterium]|nr:hypothetical protein [Flavobacteriaceae bacterium]